MKVRCNQSKARSGKKNIFLKLTQSPVSMEITVKSDKIGGGDGWAFLLWEQACHDRWQDTRASFSERQCLSTGRFCDYVVRNSQLEGSELCFCVLPAKRVKLPCNFFLGGKKKTNHKQPNQRAEVLYGMSRNILNIWSAMENSGSVNYLSTTKKWLFFPDQSFRW